VLLLGEAFALPLPLPLPLGAAFFALSGGFFFFLIVFGPVFGDAFDDALDELALLLVGVDGLPTGLARPFPASSL